jgi:hypothetical protein
MPGRLCGWLAAPFRAHAPVPPHADGVPVGLPVPPVPLPTPVAAPTRPVEPPRIEPVLTPPASSDAGVLALLRESRAGPTPRWLYPMGAAQDLLRWCQQEGYTGWLTVAEVRAAWAVRHAQIGLSTLTPEMVLSCLAEMPEVRHRRARLAGNAEYADVRRRLALQGKDASRATMYWLPPTPEDAALMAEAARVAAAVDNGAIVDGQRTPPPPARPVKGRVARTATGRDPDHEVSTSPAHAHWPAATGDLFERVAA